MEMQRAAVQADSSLGGGGGWGGSGVAKQKGKEGQAALADRQRVLQSVSRGGRRRIFSQQT